MSKYSNLVEEIEKQEEVKEQKANLDNELQLLKQTISDLQIGWWLSTHRSFQLLKL